MEDIKKISNNLDSFLYDIHLDEEKNVYGKPVLDENYSRSETKKFVEQLKDFEIFMNNFCKQIDSKDEEFWKNANKGFYSSFVECIERDLEPRVQTMIQDVVEKLNKSFYFIDGFAWRSSWLLEDKGMTQRMDQISDFSYLIIKFRIFIKNIILI